MRIVKRDVVFWLLAGVPCAVMLLWLFPVLLWLAILAQGRRLVNWLLTERYWPMPAPTKNPSGRLYRVCVCCGHRKATHENGADNCVADGCDCRGFVPRLDKHPHA